MNQPGPARGPRDHVVHLVSADVPADQGLPSLGLLLQLAGSVSAAMVCLFGFQTLLLPGGSGLGMLVTLALVVLSVVRSLMHRAAGTELLYGPQPLRGIHRYVQVALVHAVIMAVALLTVYDVSLRLSVTLGLALAIWPLLLGGIMRLPRFQRFEDELPVSEDKGFEGASVLMTTFGVTGLALGLLMLRGLPMTSNALSGTGALLGLTLLLLVVRSGAHLAAGISGLRNRSLDVVVERVAVYANLGIISAVATSGVLLIMVMGTVPNIPSLVMIAVLGWMLATWPTALRRFFADRQFGSFLAGDHAPIHRRSPDAGLTALGWLMIAMGALSASFLVVGLGVSSHLTGSTLMNLAPNMGALWWSVPVALLQIYVGFELVRMGPNYRAIATASGWAIILLHVANHWLSWRSVASLRFDQGSLLTMIAMPGPLLVSVVMLVLVHRKIAPMAQVVRRS